MDPSLFQFGLSEVWNAPKPFGICDEGAIQGSIRRGRRPTATDRAPAGRSNINVLASFAAALTSLFALLYRVVEAPLLAARRKVSKNLARRSRAWEVKRHFAERAREFRSE
jgi:hypothetical protein